MSFQISGKSKVGKLTVMGGTVSIGPNATVEQSTILPHATKEEMLKTIKNAFNSSESTTLNVASKEDKPKESTPSAAASKY